ncbi:hypothetical protein HHK36_003120 [Tetracentron sinense]|uniref:Ent-kaurene oxidase n=1 Tax=Tetracentron sinense TaxID=13715 RepID=A0A834ZSR1_TETSI|nr:hypothetical protein HHK36_003120 [Tetracentron sinense]
MALADTLHDFSAMALATVALALLLVFLITRFSSNQKRSSEYLPLPVVPGLPLIGNLLQLKEKKPHLTFTKWADRYGPVYSIRTGASSMVVLNSTDVVKEAMVTRFSSISTRKLSNALKILTSDKCMVATSDYNEFHKMVKRYILTGMLGANAQALGIDVESSIYVEGLGTRLSREEIFDVLVMEPMVGAIEVDWRDFFPYLRWVPNKSVEMKIQRMDMRREAVIQALFREHKKQITSGEEIEYCYLSFLLSEAKTLTEKQLKMLIWETIIEASDTTLVVTEWAMYELAKNPAPQNFLYQEIKKVCGLDKIREEHLSQLPYLGAVFHETMRRHSPVPVIPLRYAHEDTQLGGYHIPAGSEIAINLYACNMDKKQWDDPEEWKPERFLDSKYDPMDLYKTMAFGGGKRVCAGSLQAMLISCTAIGRFIQEFEWKLKEGEEANVRTVSLTNRKLHPMQAIIKPRV